MSSLDTTLRDILSSAKRIAVIGIKDHPSEDAFLVPRYLHECGYQILPVNPKLESVLEQPMRRLYHRDQRAHPHRQPLPSDLVCPWTCR